MSKRFISKKKRKKRFHYKFLLFVLLFIFSIITTFKYLLKSDIKINDKNLVKFLLTDLNHNNGVFSFVVNKLKQEYSPVDLLSTNYYNLVPKKIKNTNKINSNNNNGNYLIYIYNSHQEEQYAPSTFVEAEVNPTVMMASYIMQDVFDKNNFQTIVEERSIKEILNNNNWKYYKSYDASRIYLDDTKKQNPSIKYFIDVHRDSLTKDKTTVEIGEKQYAKIIFLLGLENPKYEENLEFITKINNKINEKYPNLSKGIYKKGGAGVNGVYNQDNSKYTILVEIGGVDNTTAEVLNTTLAFSECFMEVISSNEG